MTRKYIYLKDREKERRRLRNKKIIKELEKVLFEEKKIKIKLKSHHKFPAELSEVISKPEFEIFKKRASKNTPGLSKPKGSVWAVSGGLPGLGKKK